MTAKIRVLFAVALLSVPIGGWSLPPKADSASRCENAEVTQPSRHKAVHIDQVIVILRSLSLIARSNRSPSNLDQQMLAKLRKLIAQLSRVDDLLTLALMCRSVVLISTDVTTLQYDRVFDEAFWYCVNSLSKRTSDEAVTALETLKQYANTDAGHTRLLDEAIEDQKSKRKREEHR